MGTEEMAQFLNMLIGLAVERDSVPAISSSSQSPVTLVPWNLTHSCRFCGHDTFMSMMQLQTSRHTHMHTNKNRLKATR